MGSRRHIQPRLRLAASSYISTGAGDAAAGSWRTTGPGDAGSDWIRRTFVIDSGVQYAGSLALWYSRLHKSSGAVNTDFHSAVMLSLRAAVSSLDTFCMCSTDTTQDSLAEPGGTRVTAKKTSIASAANGLESCHSQTINILVRFAINRASSACNTD